jgi:hypothetical protein
LDLFLGKDAVRRIRRQGGNANLKEKTAGWRNIFSPSIGFGFVAGWGHGNETKKESGGGGAALSRCGF